MVPDQERSPSSPSAAEGQREGQDDPPGPHRGHETVLLGSSLRGAATKTTAGGALHRAAYAVGWKKCEPAWNLVIRSGIVGSARPLFERVLEKPVLGGPGHRRGPRRKAQLRPYVGDVAVHRVAADVETVRDFLVAQPLSHEAQHLELP